MQGYLFNKPVNGAVIDPAVWFKPREAGLAAQHGMTPLEVSRAFADPGLAESMVTRPPRRG